MPRPRTARLRRLAFLAGADPGRRSSSRQTVEARGSAVQPPDAGGVAASATSLVDAGVGDPCPLGRA